MITTEEAVRRGNTDKQCGPEKLLPRIVTTSWDDGDPCDLRVAEMLHARSLSGTFYVPITGHHGTHALGINELRTLDSGGFEVGGHGLSHLTLSQCTREVLICEVETCKRRLEDILGSEVRMFAYPRGRFNDTVIHFLKQAGYAGARTTRMLAQSMNFSPYKMPTTMHAFPHSASDYFRNAARAVDFGAGWKYFTQLQQMDSWVAMAKTLFDSVMQRGGVFHLYGHSWEIDELDLWGELGVVLDHVSDRDGVLYLSNSEILNYNPARDQVHFGKHCPSEG